MPRPAALCVLFVLPFLASADERWKVQYEYDKADTILNLRDFQCPSVQRCIGAGVIVDQKGRSKGATVISSDTGQHWSVAEVKEQPLSLDFLNDSAGWMVTDKGVWSTNESGRTWKKLDGIKKGVVRVHFLNEQHGFAIGFPKMVVETTDGGKTWAKVAEADKPSTPAEQTVYDCIAFRGNHGVILGRQMPPQWDQDPIWMDPQRARYRRERQMPSVMLETFDSGKTWKSSTTSVLGHITQVRLTNDALAITLVEYEDYFQIPSNVYEVNVESNSATNVFAEQDRAVRDVRILPDGRTLLAAVEPPGKSNQVPIPGKLKMLVSDNRKVWREMDVDYRAVAQRAILAAPDERHVWVATDTGMILNLLDTGSSTK